MNGAALRCVCDVEEGLDGDQASWNKGVDDRIERLLHRNGGSIPWWQAAAPARVAAAAVVTFEPSARTAWHTHPLEQTLIVTAGFGRLKRWGGLIEEIRPGDVVWFEPGEKHWHGASPTTALTHIAIQEQLDGRAVEWMEHVSDDQYVADRKAK